MLSFYYSEKPKIPFNCPFNMPPDNHFRIIPIFYDRMKIDIKLLMVLPHIFFLNSAHVPTVFKIGWKAVKFNIRFINESF